MLKKLFPLSYPKKSVWHSVIGYIVIYFVMSLTKGTLVYFCGEGSTGSLVGGIIALVGTVYIFAGLLALCFDHLKLGKK